MDMLERVLERNQAKKPKNPKKKFKGNTAFFCHVYVLNTKTCKTPKHDKSF